MGISGLLPLLKSIQRQRHLSEFGGQTVAVDAYVWLHRGTYACATELATGKATTKYVDYAMHRVRMLRHHKITPYLVFDGGPLPAKRGTEVDRAARRAEHLSRGLALAARGQHSAARECFCKCVDVTPQMAFQFIKALRAEGVQYVVAPYEADAQLAFLARTGVVNAVLTEDSDLLVFGCSTVLFKLDITSQTLSSISRSDFGSLHGTSAQGGINLLGWTDAQFRAMAVLSGCDYLPSVPGVGLKTAHALLRKCKTAEAAVRSLRLEGKRVVPRGYEDAVRDAERVFLHQRVYDPSSQRLVHCTDIPTGEEWDDRIDKVVGEDIESGLAQRIAEGNACPISLLPMDDINPKYQPGSRPPPLQMTNMNIRGTNSVSPAIGKGKTAVRPATTGGIAQFFAKTASTATATRPVTTSAATSSSRPSTNRSVSTPTPRAPAPGVGRASGKRTLTGVMEDDIAARRIKRQRSSLSPSPALLPIAAGESSPHAVRSRYFRGSIEAGPSNRDSQKENTPLPLKNADDALNEAVKPDDEGDERLSALSTIAQASVDKDADAEELWVEWEEQPPTRAWPDEDDAWLGVDDIVTQEDGYASPTGSTVRAETEELSSPARPRIVDFGDCDDVLSSPAPIRIRRSPMGVNHADQHGLVIFGNPTDDIECFEENGRATPTPRAKRFTSGTIELAEVPIADEDELEDLEDTVDGEAYEENARPARVQAVAAGLRARFSCGSSTVATVSRPTATPKKRNTVAASTHAVSLVQQFRAVARQEGVDEDENDDDDGDTRLVAGLAARYSFAPVS